MREQIVQDPIRAVVALDLDDDPHALAVALIADVADARQLLVLDEIRDLLDERRLVHGVRKLADDDRLAAAAHVLDVRLRAHQDATAPVGIGPPDRIDPLDLAGLDVLLFLEAVDQTTAGEVWAEDRVAEVVRGELGIVDEALCRESDLGQVVRRDVRRHTDRDARGPVDEQVRNARRQDDGLDVPAVVIGHPVDGVLVDVGE